MSYLVDSHCHLNYPGMSEDIPAVLERARAAGVGRFLAIGTQSDDWDKVKAIAEQDERVFCSVGVHPHEAEPEADIGLSELLAAADHRRVVAIGECGLDYYYEHSPKQLQQQSFRLHIEAARETGLPLIVHTRDAEADTADILRAESKRGGFNGVIHCFTSSAEFARFALDLGFYISLSGIVTFKSAKELQETAKSIPLDRLLVETDSPYLAPVPVRGRPCEPAFITHTANFLCGLRGISLPTLAEATTANFFNLFQKAS
jgi:TatD DNase family protein